MTREQAKATVDRLWAIGSAAEALRDTLDDGDDLASTCQQWQREVLAVMRRLEAAHDLKVYSIGW